MPKLTPKNYSLNDYDFLTLSKTESRVKSRVRLLVLHHLQQEKKPEEIAPVFGMNPYTVMHCAAGSGNLAWKRPCMTAKAVTAKASSRLKMKKPSSSASCRRSKSDR